MTLIKRQPERAVRVDPSARDPIGSWLDVFIALLALPRHERQTIRDELEDHLRSRVDDLVITGLDEPDAVRRAVGELGETAELARAFRAAARPNQRRRQVMAASLFTVLGASIVMGVATLTGGHPGAPSAPAASVDGTLEHASETLIPVRGETFGSMFERLRALSDRPMLVHWDRLEQVGIGRDDEIGLDVDPLPAHVVHRLLIERTEAIAGEPIAVSESDGLIEVSTRSHFDQRTMELRTYDIRDLIEMRSGMDASTLLDIGETGAWHESADAVYEKIARLVGEDNWASWGGGLAHGQVVGASLLVEAPARIHEKIERVLAMVREDAERTRCLAGEAAAREAASREDQHARLQRDLDQTITELAAQSAQRELIERQMRADDISDEQFKALNVESMWAFQQADLLTNRIERIKRQILDLEFSGAGSAVTGSGTGRGGAGSAEGVVAGEQMADAIARRIDAIDKLEQQGRIDADRAAMLRERVHEQVRAQAGAQRAGEGK